jgi:hypothetical protein
MLTLSKTYAVKTKHPRVKFIVSGLLFIVSFS